MANDFTRVTLFVPGTPGSAAAWNEGLLARGLRIEDGVLCAATASAPESRWSTSTTMARSARRSRTARSRRHPCHNPYGVWRLGPPGGTSRPRGELIPVFVPALRAVLHAVEAQNGAPLTRAQVESLRDRATAVAMTAPDAARLERSRGYADLDPDHVWEQWQLVREAAG